RTDLAAGEHPGHAALERTARAMAARLGWAGQRTSEEIERAGGILARHHARAKATLDAGGPRYAEQRAAGRGEGWVRLERAPRGEIHPLNARLWLGRMPPRV